MALIPDIVGILLAGPPSDGDLTGARYLSRVRVPALTEVTGVVLRARRVATVAIVEALVLTDFGSYKATFPEDQLKTSANTWFTRTPINI